MFEVIPYKSQKFCTSENKLLETTIAVDKTITKAWNYFLHMSDLPKYYQNMNYLKCEKAFFKWKLKSHLVMVTVIEKLLSAIDTFTEVIYQINGKFHTKQMCRRQQITKISRYS